MKILFFLGSFFPAQCGGPNNSVYWMAKELVRRGYDITIVTFYDGITEEHIKKYKIEFNSRVNIDGIHVYYYSYSISRYFSFRVLTWLLDNISKYDFVSVNSLYFSWSWVVAFIAAVKKVPFSISPRGELEPGALKFSRIRKSIVNWLFLKKLMRKSKFVHVTSEQERASSESFFSRNANFEIFPNYIELPAVNLNTELIRGKRDILYLGRLHPKKGVERLIEGFELFSMQGKNCCELNIVGTGSSNYVNSLKACADKSRISNMICFHGHLDGIQKTNFLANSKVLVLPSFSENFGNVVLEALAHGTPVIASTMTPWHELVTYKSGLWIHNDKESIAHALDYIFSLDDVCYEQLAYSALIHARSLYDVRENGEKLINIYQKYIS